VPTARVFLEVDGCSSEPLDEASRELLDVFGGWKTDVLVAPVEGDFSPFSLRNSSVPFPVQSIAQYPSYSKG